MQPSLRCRRGELLSALAVLLRRIFPDGVCDWSRRGVNHVPLRVGLSFGPAPTHRHGHDDENDD